MASRRSAGYWTKERALATLQELVAEGFDISKTSQLKPDIFSGVASAFGSFRKACEVAGIEYNVPERVRLNMTPDELAQVLRDHAAAGTLGRIILDRVYIGAFNRKFMGRLKGAFQTAGLEPPECLGRSFTSEEIADYLVQYAQVEGGTVPVKRLTPKAQRAIRRTWGTLANAAQALHIQFEGTDDDLPELKPRGRRRTKNKPPAPKTPATPKQEDDGGSDRYPQGFWSYDRVIEMTRQRMLKGTPINLQNRDDRRLYAAARMYVGSLEEAARIAGVPYVVERKRRPRQTRWLNEEELARLVRKIAESGVVDLSQIPGWLQLNLEHTFRNLQRAADAIGVTFISREGITIVPTEPQA